MSFKITEIWAYIAVDPNDLTHDEGIAAFRSPEQGWMPLIMADRARLESMEPIARGLATDLGVGLELVKFTQREHVGDLHPDQR